MYLVYTNDAGEQRILRGGPEGSSFTNAMIGDIEVVDVVYKNGAPDWDGNNTHIRQEIFTGTDAEMYAKIDLARAEMTRINSEGYDYNLPLIDTLIAGWGGANDQNSNTVVARLAEVMGLKPLVLNFVSTNNLSVPGYDATLEHSLFERTTESLYQGLKDAGNTVSELWNGIKSFVGNAYEGVQDFFFGLFAREGEVIVGPLQQVDNSLLNLTITTSPDSNNATADPNTFTNGTVKSGGDYSIDMPSDVLNEDGLNNQEASKITSNEIRPGANTLTQNDTSGWLDQTANFLQQNLVQPIADLGSSVWSGIQSAFSSITNLFSDAPKVQNVDPLILDLNGNGVELIAFKDSKVSFDVDNDNYKENTGWVKGTDGILVEDKNNNGKIDNITETISEHYTSNVADGLEALKTLDSNNDGKFDSSDAKWNDLKVWVDANEDGVTDQGELKTLSELNIQSIDLSRTIAYHERIAGNPVLSRSTYTTTDGQTHEAAAVDFTTNPIGYEWNDAYEQGAKISAQDGSSSSFVITDANGATINLAEKGVNSGYGNIGNDTIIGDAGNNWLMGGKGSDTLKSGAGDDIIMIDSEDKNENIDAGEGLDVIKVIDDRSIVFNMSLSHAEVIKSGGGDDVLIGGGASNVFISGGAGDDIIIGGAADDALSGEDGEDYIDGGYGDDVIRGHRGNDVLIGGEGNDYLEGGKGEDILQGGVGNDVLIGDEGNDQIDGGDGFDMVEYAGKYDQYTFNRNADGTVTVTDTVDGSVDTIKNVERLRFDHVDVNIAGASTALPLPVKDNITVNGNGAFEINQSQLLANDFSTSGKSFSVRNVSDAVGGTVELRADGKIIFTPDPNFIGTMSFDYSVIDSDGNYAKISRKKSDGTVEQADLKAQVNLTNESDPSDPLYYDQWYLSEIKVKPVWADYSGKGVSIGVFEGDYGNPLNYRHADLNDNISADYLNDVLIEDDVTSYSNHTTLVAGVIAAEKNGRDKQENIDGGFNNKIFKTIKKLKLTLNSSKSKLTLSLPYAPETRTRSMKYTSRRIYIGYKTTKQESANILPKNFLIVSVIEKSLRSGNKEFCSVVKNPEEPIAADQLNLKQRKMFDVLVKYCPEAIQINDADSPRKIGKSTKRRSGIK